jgi:hypothetical protein
MNRFEFLLSWTIIPITIVLGLFCQKIVSFAAYLSVNLHFMKVSTENDNNIGYEKITILVDKMPLRTKIMKNALLLIIAKNLMDNSWKKVRLWCLMPLSTII